MARDLSSGSRLIRWMQVLAVVIACAGAILAVRLLVSPSPEALATLLPLMLGAFLLVALIISAAVAMLAARGLVKRINTLGGAFIKGAEGNLTVRVDLGEKDELSALGHSFNGMLGKLSGMVSGINASIAELRRIAARNDEASRKVLGAAEVQAQGLEETSEAVGAITKSAGKVAQGVAQLASSAADNSAYIKEMTESIVEVRRNVETQAASIDEVSSSITETVAVVQETDRNVADLMESARATSLSVAEMDLTLQRVEKSTQDAADITKGVSEEAQKGKEAVEATIEGIGGIRESSGTTFSSISRLSERVAAIGKIVSVIDELTEQTNLLALNSAIIAAQAGEHGKGFAIVADEIKELAQRTKSSTKEIDDLIRGIRDETGKAVAAIRITEERVAGGEQLSRRSGEALNRIVAGVQVATDQVSEIARATEEQVKGSRKIRDEMTNVADRVTQIASSSQEQTATSKSIMTAVVWMKELTTKVLASTARQEQIGERIAEGTAQMSGVVEIIRDSSVEQADCCDRITGSVVRVQGSAESNLDSARTMEAAVLSLTDQIDLLQREIAKLQVS